MDDLKRFTDYLIKNKIGLNEGIKLINGTDKLGELEKLTIKSYVYPRSILDYELPKYIKSANGNKEKEVRILVEAFKCPQYSRFMRHLTYAFLNPDLLSSVAGQGEENCPICGKKIYYYDSWDKLRDPGEETLAIMSKESSVCMCKNCLLELIESYNIIVKLEGYDFLNSRNTKNKN